MSFSRQFVQVGSIKQSGIYALVSKGVVVYVGQAQNMLVRLYTHDSTWRSHCKGKVGYHNGKPMSFDDIWIMPCPINELNRLERETIHFYEPRYNSHRFKIPLDIKALLETIVPIETRTVPQPIVQKINRRI